MEKLRIENGASVECKAEEPYKPFIEFQGDRQDRLFVMFDPELKVTPQGVADFNNDKDKNFSGVSIRQGEELPHILRFVGPYQKREAMYQSLADSLKQEKEKGEYDEGKKELLSYGEQLFREFSDTNPHDSFTWVGPESREVENLT